MKTLSLTVEPEKILRYLQYRIAEKFSVGEDVSTLLSSADVATCLHILEQLDIAATPKHLYH